MKKLFIFLFMGILILLTACNSDNKDDLGNDSTDSTSEESNITMTYVAAYTKTAGSMGVICGSHMIEFYKDNTLTIFAGFSSAVGEAQTSYDGTYSLSGSELTINYKHDETDATVTTSINNDSFRCQIFMIQSMPDDGLDENVKGLTYYKVESKEYHQMSRIYLGTYKDSNGFNAYVLELKNDNTFNINMNLNNTLLSKSGVYEIITKSIDEVDEIKFKYDVYASDNSVLKSDYEVSYEYSTDTRFRFEYLYNTLDSTNTTQLVYLK